MGAGKKKNNKISIFKSSPCAFKYNFECVKVCSSLCNHPCMFTIIPLFKGDRKRWKSHTW